MESSAGWLLKCFGTDAHGLTRPFIKGRGYETFAEAAGEEGGGEEGRRKYATHWTESEKRRVATPSHIL